MNKYTLTLGNSDLIVSLEKLAEQANGEVLVHYGDTVVLATVTLSDEDTEKDFFPLSVSYEEKFYAAGKISGPRYTRREGRPSDRATLISRMIDRAIRPKFPKELKKEVQIIVTCLSWDEENDPGVLGMIAASLALEISDVPWNGPLGSVRIGKNGEYILNPSSTERDESEIDLIVSGFISKDNKLITNMIEGSFNEVDEEVAEKAFHFAEDSIRQLCAFQEKIKKEKGKEKIELSPLFSDKKIESIIAEKIKEGMKDIFTEKEGRGDKIKKLKKDIISFAKENYEDATEKSYAVSCVDTEVEKVIRKNILEKEDRPDGRKMDEVREISTSVAILPRTHGSGIFRRGKTRSLSIITLGAPGEQQLIEEMEVSGKKRFMHHYNFPSYSVGEVKPIRGPGRRDIGHGMLAEKAIFPLLPNIEDFPYTIRAVSEILSSNGSTSMASVCSTTLALMDAGVPIKRPVAGISIGLVTGDRGDYKMLTDIQGPEDHYGDMDFKVAGTKNGITAIQMDVKIDGITQNMIKEALSRGKETRFYLLEEIAKTIETPRKELSPYAPRIVVIKVDPEKIGVIIGPKGKTINEIMEETNVSIDIDDSGLVSVTSENEEDIEKAVSRIKNLTREVKEGEIFEGKVIKIFDFGAVIEIFPGQEGLCHISEIAPRRVQSVESELKKDQIVPVKVIKVEENGKVSLSIKRAKEDKN